jgi:glycosyltransferase involved in cell wall biosynthesis
MSEIRFSIIIACYNQEAYIRESVESALSQGYAGKEVIVVDDCSSDRTAEILKTFGESISLEVLPKNSGVDASRNHGVSMAKGEYVVFLDGDDVMMPWTLDVYDLVISERNPMIILGKPVIFEGDVPEINIGDVSGSINFVEYPHFLAKDRPGVYNTSALIVNRSHFLSAGGWSKGIFYGDIQDLLIKIGTSGKMILIVEPGTVLYRMHDRNSVHKVSLFVQGIHKLLLKEKSGLYPGGRKHRGERLAWFGGLTYYWAKEAIINGRYNVGFKLLASSWSMILLAVIRRCRVMVFGRKPVESLELNKEINSQRGIN